MPEHLPAAERYRGFDLRSVCWGYREIFEESIEGLFSEGLIGDERTEVTEAFFGLLKNADQSCYDYLLKQFLAALTPQNRWIFDIPSVFQDIVETGHSLAERKLYFGIGFFRTLGEGGVGDTPARVRQALALCRQLSAIDDELAYSLLRGYGRLYPRLTDDELQRYVNEGLRIYSANAVAGRRFMSAEGKASENIIQMLTQECRLDSVRASLQRLLRALAGQEVEVDDFGKLDADNLLERGSRMIVLYRWLYLPAKIRHFPATARNRDWYRLCAVVAASMLSEKTFSALHGHPEYETAVDLVGPDIARLNVFTMLEYLRGLRGARVNWPGCRRLIDFGLRTEFTERQPGNAAEALFMDAAAVNPQTAAARWLVGTADTLVNAFATAEILVDPATREFIDMHPDLGAAPMRPYAFLPDFLFPGTVGTPAPDSRIADMKDAARTTRPKNRPHEQGDVATAEREEHGSEQGGDEGQENNVAIARFWYPEWNQAESEYLDNWCGVIVRQAETTGSTRLPQILEQTTRQVRHIFERIKPDLARTERRLPDGDGVDTDRLVSYRVLCRGDADPRIDFYERPMIRCRDLAVLVLLDLSSSTGEKAGTEKVLEIEKHAALILGQGLSALGDRFAVAGFSSRGRETCEYEVFKSFEANWDESVRARIMGAYPRNSTRIGAALRHSGYILSRVEARQRLVLLVTDGKPMDAGYDPKSRYAQHDVRMACEENERQSVCTFAISTEENSQADMEIMFSHRRYVILPDIRRLPDVLPRLYLRVTV